MNLSIAKPIVIIMLTMAPLVTYADPAGGYPGFPLEDVLTVVSLFVIAGLAISVCISLVFRHVFQKIRKEKRKHIWFMTIFTFIFPAPYIYAELTGYCESSVIVFSGITLVLLFAGFLLGYFITPKTDFHKLNTKG